MTRIPVKTFLELWEDIRKREWETDSGLARKVGVRHSTIIAWRNGATKGVQPRVVKDIEDKLGYLIELSGDKWQVQKVGADVAFKMAHFNSDQERKDFDVMVDELKAAFDKHDPEEAMRVVLDAYGKRKK